jgi:type III pantothenate kinase
MSEYRASQSAAKEGRPRGPAGKVLLIDSGNSRLKWAMLSERGLATAQSTATEHWQDSPLVADLRGASRVLIANVAGPLRASALAAAVRDHAGVEPEFVRVVAETAGVRQAYAEPARLGVDRWVAMIAARASHSGDLCVVDVGTAMTIDAVDATGRHLGGLITPGPDLMISSLFANTGDLEAFGTGGHAGGGRFADNTRGAIWQGCEQALAALVDRCVESMAAGPAGSARLIVTGGAAGRILPLLRAPYTEVRDLVLQGLAILSRG